ncbi:MAG TPA: efflux transporter periplasmic adaptor subunit [Gammaproteobacteria bacterium]|nr:efflux transporter periplasmic adaptor subunit [Gammaproteobacteria bacterium]
MKTKKWVKGLISLLIIIALVVVGIRLIQQKKMALASIPPAKGYGVVVPVQRAETSTVQLTLPYLAEVQSDTDVNIASKVTSRVNKILSSGTSVKAGQVVVQLDAGELLAKKRGLLLKIKEANSQSRARRTDLKSLRRTHARNQQLLQSQAISQEKFDIEADRIESLQATVESLQSRADALKQNVREIDDTLSYTTIKSPIDGVVSKTYVAEGGIASGGKPLLSLSGGDEKRLVVRVPDDVKPRSLLWSDQRCDLHALHRTYNGLDEYSCSLQVNLPAGNRVEVRLVVFNGDGILLPTNAVLEINGKHDALRVEGAQAHAEPVQVIAEGSEGLVVSGLHPGDEYVVAKPDILLKLLTGAPVIRAAQ